MSDSTLAVTAGAGTLLHTWTYSVGGNTVHAQFTLPDEFPYPTYIVNAVPSAATANDHLLQLMAGSSLTVRIRRIRIQQQASASAVAAREIDILRLTTAGTGGTAITPAKFDTTDGAAGATAMTLPSSKGTESTILLTPIIILRQALLTTGSQIEPAWEWTQHPGEKPLIIPAGAANGIAIKTLNASTSATLMCSIEFTEMNH